VKSPLVSIIVTSYNHGKFVNQCLDSLINQTYKNIEIILADDCSRDNSQSILEQYCKLYPDKFVKLFQKENIGLTANLNEAMKIVKGDYICWVATDDYWVPGKIEKQVKLMEENQDIGFCYSDVYIVNEDGQLIFDPFAEKIKSLHTGNVENIFHKLMVHANFINAQTVMSRKSCYDKIGYFDEKIFFLSDFDLWVRLSIYFDSYYIKEKLAYYRKHEQSFTHIQNSGVKRKKSDIDYTRIYKKNTLLYYNLTKQGKKDLISYLYVASKSMMYKKRYILSMVLLFEIFKFYFLR
jgi:glycosyltransferase involved in cell wall biosynthesis